MTTYVDRIHHGGSGILVEEATNNGTITFTTKNSGTPSEKFRITSTGVLVSADLAMGGNKITGLGAPTASTDVATKGYIDTEISNVGTSISAVLPLTGGTMLGAIAMGTNKITGLGTPSATGDAATKGYVDTEVSNLVDSSPTALNTLNELAAAINDDANFSTTITNNIAGKLPLAGGTMTGDITFNSSQTFDGRDVSADGAKLDLIEAGATADQTASEIKSLYESNSNTNEFSDAEQTKLAGIAAGAEVNVQSDWNASSGDAAILNKPTIPTNNNQLTNGAGYITSADGGNADTVDGLHATSFVRTDQASTITSGNLTLSSGDIIANNGTNNRVHLQAGDGSIEISRNNGGAYIDFKNNVSEDHDARLQESNGKLLLNSNEILTTAFDISTLTSI